MSEYYFLSEEEVLLIHAYQLQHYGGRSGIRDRTLLQSALAAPYAGFGNELLHKSIGSMAAAYLYHLAMNHPFIDGNKRVGLEAALDFLEMNNHRLVVDGSELYELVIGIASGRVSKDETVRFFEERITPK